MNFTIATKDGPVEVDGLKDAFLGMHSEKPDYWSVTHLGSGRLVGIIQASFGTAKLILSELSRAGDWSFSDMKAWKDTDPDLPRKVVAFAQEFEEFRPVSDASPAS